jgi:hypothetical protein
MEALKARGTIVTAAALVAAAVVAPSASRVMLQVSF